MEVSALKTAGGKEQLRPSQVNSCDPDSVCPVPPHIFRNAVLESSLSDVSSKAPRARKTGTTIAGIVYKVLHKHKFVV